MKRHEDMNRRVTPARAALVAAAVAAGASGRSACSASSRRRSSAARWSPRFPRIRLNSGVS